MLPFCYQTVISDCGEEHRCALPSFLLGALHYRGQLLSRGLCPNTASFYLRNLRSASNKAVKAGLCPAPRRNPFADVYTGVSGTRKRAVDGNVLRVAARITGDSGDITSPAMKKKVTAALQAVIPTGEPGNFNQAMMELGATVCLPNGAPLCEKCPAASFCRALREDRIGELPVKAPKKARRIEERRVYLIFSDDGVALRRRPGKGLLAGLWEYPNELTGEETISAALGLSPADLELVGTGKHIFTHIEWRMTAYAARTEAQELPQGWVWAGREALAREYAVPNAFQAFSEYVKGKLGYFS